MTETFTALESDEQLTVYADGAALRGHLRIPPGARAIVLVAHGSGTWRDSPRNAHIAGQLTARGLGSLTLDLLTPAEATTDLVFDVILLGRRLLAVRHWLAGSPHSWMPVGLFGIGSDAPVALWTAGEPDIRLGTVVVHGARPDLAADRLTQVLAPTLFVSGGTDERIRRCVRTAAALVPAPTRITELAVTTQPVPRDRLGSWSAYLASVWFGEHLGPDHS
ncbi:dienelactone hydrolase family protein [Nocardia harenae]|uniref:dienelactone hydrolase family protein n=1 Tax=Nocardia harenae TaxID=358707 RepID=UPI00082EDB66|nr:alpha/beta hydrolase [Nocardia harenae]